MPPRWSSSAAWNHASTTTAASRQDQHHRTRLNRRCRPVQCGHASKGSGIRRGAHPLVSHPCRTRVPLRLGRRVPINLCQPPSSPAEHSFDHESYDSLVARHCPSTATCRLIATARGLRARRGSIHVKDTERRYGRAPVREQGRRDSPAQRRRSPTIRL